MRIIFLLLLIVIPQVVFSQKYKSLKHNDKVKDSAANKVDTTYIKKYNDRFILKLDLTNTSDYYVIKEDGVKYKVKPNTQ